LSRYGTRRSMTTRIMSGWITVASCFIPCAAWAQGGRADYQRANNLSRQLEGTVFKDRVTPHWDAKGSRFWYRNDLSGGEREFIRVDAVKGVRELAFDHKKLAEALAKALGKPLQPERLPLDNLVFDDAKTISFSAAGKRWECSLPGYSLREMGKP